MSYKNKLEFKQNIKAVKTSVSAFQLPGSSWENVSGSIITYKPSENSSNVVYEFVTQMDYADADNDIDFQLQIGDDINSLGDVVTDNTGYFCSVGGNNTTDSEFLSLVSLKFLISSSGWTSNKTIALQAKNPSSTKESYLHYNQFGSSKVASGEEFFHPFVITYSI